MKSKLLGKGSVQPSDRELQSADSSPAFVGWSRTVHQPPAEAAKSPNAANGAATKIPSQLEIQVIPVNEEPEARSGGSREMSSGFISQLLFAWLNPLMALGYTRTLGPEDLYPLWEADKTESSGAVFSHYWEREKTKIKPSVLKALHYSFGKRFYLAGILKFIHDSFQFCQPVLLHALLSFIAHRQGRSIWYGVLIALGMFGASLCQTLFVNRYFHMCFRVGMHIRGGLVSAIYRKSLLMNAASRQSSSVGQVVTLMSSDAQRLMDLTTYLHILWSGPFQIALSIYLLFRMLSWSAFAGLACMILMMPLNTFMAGITARLRKESVKYTDERVKVINEVFQGIKIIKLMAWEDSFVQKVGKIRDRELSGIRRMVYTGAFTSFMALISPVLVSVSTFAVYTLTGHKLTAASAFTSLQLFNALRFPLMMVPNIVNGLGQAKVALQRIKEFLMREEVESSYVTATPVAVAPAKQAVVAMKGATFGWAGPSATNPDVKPTLSNVSLDINKGDLVVVVGTVGAGKTSLLNAIIGEMQLWNGQVSLFQPSKLKIAYAAQESWILNATVRDNILFGNKMDRVRYDTTLSTCALLPDLEILQAGDMTEIGEKGINLSGGQKARVSLARAVYSDADLYLLDDPLSAVDSHVGKHLFEECINGVLKNKTRILCTHHVQYMAKADLVVVLKDGAVAHAGTYKSVVEAGLDSSNLLGAVEEDDASSDTPAAEEDLPKTISKAHDPPAPAATNGHTKPLEKTMTKTASGMPQGTSGQLVKAEGRETGSVKLKVYKDYVQGAGGTWVIFLTLFLFTMSQVSRVSSDWWLAYWSSHNTGNRVEQAHRGPIFFLVGYIIVSVAACLFVLVRSLQLSTAAIQAARHFHHRLFEHLLHVPMNFFDQTPIGRITNRFSSDMDKLDQSVSSTLGMYFTILLQVASSMLVIVGISPLFVLPMIFLGFCYRYIQRYFMASSRELKRLDSVSKSPIYAHFSETIVGISTIRAYHSQQRFIKKHEEILDHNQKAYFLLNASNRWLGVRLESVGTFIVFAASMLGVLLPTDPGLAGMSLTNAMQVTSMLNYMVRMSTEVEIQMNSMERVLEYLKLEPEAPYIIPDFRPSPAWPQKGQIEFKNLGVRYRADLVLKGISCSFNGGEKVGVVGRTGAGKSTLVQSLFRLVEPAKGSIVIDGIDTGLIGLRDLRSKLSIIPQDPVLFSGTIRSNLDPFNEHSDEDLYKVLDKVSLRRLVDTAPEGLEMPVSEGGTNLSSGQKQLVCLARVLLRSARILVLDEATSSVDIETDAMVQRVIRDEFRDATVVAIAHRLNTIIDSNRVLVLSQGLVAEFDSPRELAARPDSEFAKMLASSGQGTSGNIGSARSTPSVVQPAPSKPSLI